MSKIIQANTGLVFMKVGLHSGEEFSDILERKKREFKDAGMSFWGYGGGVCHPTHQVQPFAKMRIEEGAAIYLVMEKIDSHHKASDVVATEFSKDGLEWEPIPNGIEVRGSRYALVIEDIEDEDLKVDLASYKVGIGASQGKRAADYVKGRVDKACLLLGSEPPKTEGDTVKQIAHIARLKEPYAVFTR